ncbi:FHA domain-containing protein [Mycolicibacterium moriokaense]|uniref:FHA domain-containing protein n=1 Tax=Mycolicibacterium moriokaense TaxID=39691 RepID=A0A318HD23_9MYCO|nr:FHA domain-containing protein [Mycolicibacterium moriokaense]PXW98875.1 FHA domain-containing protein [Mycolicibacterium moriokaense]
MTHPDNDPTSGDAASEATATLNAEFLGALNDSAVTDADSVVSTANWLPSGSALLVVKRGPNTGARFVLDQPVTAAGRHPGATIYLDDITVSRRHAEFRMENGTFSVIDVGSLNGTYLNREPVQSAALADGDEIQIGKFRLVFARP